MELSALEKRIRALELKSSHFSPVKQSSSGTRQKITDDTVSLLGELEEIAGEIRLIREEALVAGDDRLVLACAREFCRVAELSARLRGEIEEKTTTNVLHLHLDAKTAIRMAEIYLARRKKLESFRKREELYAFYAPLEPLYPFINRFKQTFSVSQTAAHRAIRVSLFVFS